MKVPENQVQLYKDFIQQWKTQNQTRYITRIFANSIFWVSGLFVIFLGLLDNRNGISSEGKIVVIFFCLVGAASWLLGFKLQMEQNKEWKAYCKRHQDENSRKSS